MHYDQPTPQRNIHNASGKQTALKLNVKALALLLLLIVFTLPNKSLAQVDEDQLGIWTAYSWSTRFEDSKWGLQGDFQLRNWDIYSDLEQYLIRGGLTYSPDSSVSTFRIGLATVTSSEFGDGKKTNTENRIFQEASFPQRLGKRIFLRHRFRVEQRWIENQDFRTRYRYSLAMNIPLNQVNLGEGAWYVSTYNELFLNGEREIGDKRRVDIFDRNRSYVGIGHRLQNNLQLQFGYMHQWTDDIHKGQLQVSLSQRF